MSEKIMMISDYVCMYNAVYNAVQQELVKEMVDADIALMRSNPNAWACTLAAHLHTMDLCVYPWRNTL